MRAIEIDIPAASGRLPAGYAVAKARCAVAKARSCAGLTIIEVVFSIGIMALVGAGIIAVYTMGLDRANTVRSEYSAAEFLTSQVQQALVLPYTADSKPLDSEITSVIPEILKANMTDPSGTSSAAPSTFNYNAGGIPRDYTPSFHAYDGRATGTTPGSGWVTFSTIPVYNSANPARSDLAPDQITPLVSGTFRKRVIKVDDQPGIGNDIVVGGTNVPADRRVAEDLGIRIIELELSHNLNLDAGRQLPVQRVVTFRAPDSTK